MKHKIVIEAHWDNTLARQNVCQAWRFNEDGMKLLVGTIFPNKSYGGWTIETKILGKTGPYIHWSDVVTALHTQRLI
jgi:hypothetical protein